MINKIDLRKAISSIAISNAKRNTIYKAFSDLDSITKEEFDSVKSDISKVVESMLTKDTVGKANGVASLDSNGNVPIEQLSNIDTTLFLIVRELPTTDVKTNKIYLVPNQDGQGNNVYIEYLYVEDVWEKLGEFKAEVDLSHIEAKLNTKADKTDVNSHLDNLRNRCFRLVSGGISAPYSENIGSFTYKILQLNNKEYSYADLSCNIQSDGMYIYDDTIDSFIKITKQKFFDFDRYTIIFNTNKPLNLTHEFYFDNEKIGNGESLKKLIIKENDIFANIAYLCTNSDKSLKYIYDATDNNWISIVEIYPAHGYTAFNTEISLDLTDRLYYSSYPTFLVDWPIVGEYSIALGGEAAGNYSTALGYNAQSVGNAAIALGYNAQAVGDNAIALGYGTQATSIASIALAGEATGILSIALGYDTQAAGNYSIALGTSASTSIVSKYALGGTDENKGDRFNIEEITYSQYGNKKYLIGLGGYDGTNITTNNEAGEKVLNPNIKSVQEIINSKAELVDGKVKAEQLPKLVNITNASTAEEVVTKFNALLADLKAKGYMKADTPQ